MQKRKMTKRRNLKLIKKLEITTTETVKDEKDKR